MSSERSQEMSEEKQAEILHKMIEMVTDKQITLMMRLKNI